MSTEAKLRVYLINLDRSPERLVPFVDAAGELHVPVPLTAGNVVVLNESGLALHDFKRYQQAVAYFDCAIQLRDDVPELYYNRGNALTELHRYEEAVASDHQAIAAKPDYASAYNNRGFALQHLGRIDEAIASYDKVLALQPSHSRARVNRDALLKKAAATLRGEANPTTKTEVKADG